MLHLPVITISATVTCEGGGELLHTWLVCRMIGLLLSLAASSAATTVELEVTFFHDKLVTV